MHRTMTIFLAPHDHMDVYLSNHKYTVQQEATKVIGVDTARYLFEVDGRYEEIRTMADGVWGITSEVYRMNGNRRISDAVIIVVDMPEDKDFHEMCALARYFLRIWSRLSRRSAGRKTARNVEAYCGPAGYTHPRSGRRHCNDCQRDRSVGRQLWISCENRPRRRDGDAVRPLFGYCRHSGPAGAARRGDRLCGYYWKFHRQPSSF